ncbi:hypothetical protein MIND_00528900 [Mycena indigotica]|uniref:Transmembrane protein n=1 Tax=Mycena indigotica TaxID=2126181 RepID=A0A8H6W684_9AGAR|nr:uncharacterized protein MIND_00528900 [Mycena indigotica]KAF7307349.1 hypothetical protein MIND_00528900 [Mycena indigotica]
MRNAALFIVALATVGVLAQSSDVHPMLQTLSQYIDVSRIEPLRAKAEIFIEAAKVDPLVAAQTYPETAIVFFSAFFIVLGFLGTLVGCVVPQNKESQEDIELKQAAAVPVPAMKSNSSIAPLKKRK